MMDGFQHEYCPSIVSGCQKMQYVVLLIFKVSEHDNQPELEHELLPQYGIDTGEHDGNVCFFRNNILQYETAIRNMSSAEDWAYCSSYHCYSYYLSDCVEHWRHMYCLWPPHYTICVYYFSSIHV